MNPNEMPNTFAPSSEKKLSKLERAKLATAEATQKALGQGEKNLEQLALEAEKLKQAKVRDAEELALLIEPLCQAMLRLTQETQETFRVLREEAQNAREQRAREQERSQKETLALAANFQAKVQASTENYSQAAKAATTAAHSLRAAQQNKDWLHYGLIVGVSLLASLCSNVFLQWLSPPKIENSLQLNTETLLQRLKEEQEILLGPPQDRTEKTQKTKPKR